MPTAGWRNMRACLYRFAEWLWFPFGWVLVVVVALIVKRFV